uniref:Uncharacterized protein n=1 Tax=Eutreptiella gymnastica TaxID=73025 RepID=A0A7S4C9Q6_9EUGL
MSALHHILLYHCRQAPAGTGACLPQQLVTVWVQKTRWGAMWHHVAHGTLRSCCRHPEKAIIACLEIGLRLRGGIVEGSGIDGQHCSPLLCRPPPPRPWELLVFLEEGVGTQSRRAACCPGRPAVVMLDLRMGS